MIYYKLISLLSFSLINSVRLDCLRNLPKFIFYGSGRAIAPIACLLLVSCGGSSSNSANSADNFTGLKIKVLVGSALGDFCTQAAQEFNKQNPKLDSGTEFRIICQQEGSGDVVTTLVNLGEQLKSGAIKPEDTQFPSLVSLDGEIYQSQLIYRFNQLFPGQKYIPEIIESPLLASSPMVFMTQPDLAPSLQKIPDLFKALVTAKTHKDLDPAAPAIPINYVHTAPTKSNSGLQSLVAQYASVSGKRPEDLTTADIAQFQGQVQQIQSKITRYGVSTNSLAKAMAQNGVFWASVGSVYESSVVGINSSLPAGSPKLQAVYPKSTFSSNMRLILPNAPWVSAEEKAAVNKVIEAWRSPPYQQIATNLGLRAGTPGIPLGAKITPEFGVNPQATYDSYRPPQPEVVDAMLKSWQEVTKRPSQVVVVVDTSGSMKGEKMSTVQNTLLNYINKLGPKEKIAVISFSNEIRPPFIIEGTPEGKAKGVAFVGGLVANGGTNLYDAILTARNWLQKNRAPNAINAVLVLTDGEDSGSKISLDKLGEEIKKSGFSSDERLAFFTIGYGNDGEFNAKALQKVAELNAGYYSKGDPASIGKIMDNLQVEF